MISMIIKKNIIFIFFGALLIFSPSGVGSQSLKDNVTGQLKAGGSKAGFQVQNVKAPQQIIAEVIQIVLSITGTIFTGLIIYAGYNLMTAAGEQDKIDTGKKTIIGAIIGLTITLAAYSIANFVAKRTYNVTTGTNTYKIEDSSHNTQGLNIIDAVK